MLSHRPASGSVAIVAAIFVAAREGCYRRAVVETQLRRVKQIWRESKYSSYALSVPNLVTVTKTRAKVVLHS